MAAIQSETSARYPGSARGSFAPVQGFVGRMREDKGLMRRVLMIGGVAVVAIAALAFWLMGGRYVSTDDSYVQTAKLMVSTDVSGLVKTVNVHEGQRVKKGQVLFTLDPRPFQIALDNAKAQLGQVVQAVQSTKSDYQSMLSTADAQRAQVDLNQRNYDRYAALLKANAIAPATYDQARLTLATSQQQLVAAEQAAKTQLAKLNGNPNIAPEQTPQYQAAKAAVDEAQRQLNHATVRAPFDGIVAEVDSLQPGTLVISAMSAFSTTSAVGLIGTGKVWIEAHMKETDLTHVKSGDPVSITIDTYPGRTWHGHVDAVSAASGAAFSVLPAENASGNWVKVTQRIPTRIVIDRKKGDPELRSGMSAVVDIDTGKRTWQRLFSDR
ncbi:MAG: HlyD family secretion protein [Proteobacteria bacterium]|nr:HlyD family secretion protein [Pseudomonadota bacterium]